MKRTLPHLLVITTFLFSTSLTGQDSLLTTLAKENLMTFSYNGSEFTGKAWDFIQEKTIESKNILVGEDHFSNEIPLFVQALSDLTKFDNFYIEVDPHSTKIIEQSFKNYSDEERAKFNREFGELFSFYSLHAEYDLLAHFVDQGARVLGSDQVVMYADRLVFHDLVGKTDNPEAKQIYQKIAQRSKEELERFHAETRNPMTMYFMTPEFLDDLEKLKALKLSENESSIVEDMERSVTIYKNQDHIHRVKLLLHYLMKDYPIWKNEKNIFKYGANHMARGESFLGNYDIGNMVANITEANFEESFHIMIVGESGKLGSPFKSFPSREIKIEKGFYLHYLKPFFKLTDDSNWSMFNLVPLRKQLKRKKLKVDDPSIERLIKGFDILIIIPEVTPAKYSFD